MDDAHAAGKDIRPLCGLAFAVKDNLDVVGYATEAGTPALAGSASLLTPHGSARHPACLLQIAHLQSMPRSDIQQQFAKLAEHTALQLLSPDAAC